MKFYLLDGAGAGLAIVALMIFMILAVSVEAIVMLLMKYNKAGKAFLDSFLVNLASLAAGYLLSSATGSIYDITESVILNWVILYALTLGVEFLVLYLLNRTRPVNKTFLTCAVMNVVSYLILYFFFGIDL